MIRRSGFGVISKPDGSWETPPGWCNWLPFADFWERCQPPTQAQIDANNMASIGRSMTPENVQQLQQTWAADVASQCQQNPDACADLKRWQDCVAQYGTGAFCASGLGPLWQKLGAPDLTRLGSNLGWIAIAVVGGILFVTFMRR
jgi:hypothetical protein